MALQRIIREQGREWLGLKNPANGKEIFDPLTKMTGKPVLINTEDEIRTIVAEARQAYRFWKCLDRKQKGSFIRALKQEISKHANAIAQIIGQENGKPLLECYEEALTSADLLKFYEKDGLSSSREFRGTSPINKCKTIKTTTVPSLRGKEMGVAGAICPWNYPFLIYFSIAARALFYGNPVVFKPSEQTPLVAEFVKYLADNAWKKSGLEKFWKLWNRIQEEKSEQVTKFSQYNPLRVIQGDYRAGELLVNLLNEEKIDFLFFCGSSEVGRKIKQAANDKSKLELLLSGKDPFIMLKDCDIDTTVDALIGACLYNGGQSCSSTERVYVAEEIIDVVLKKILERVEKIDVGYNPDNPYINIGPMMNKKVFDNVMAHIQDAKNKGAKVLFGGTRKTGGIHDLGYYIAPTVLFNVDHGMRIMQEETFGPVMPIMTFKTKEEVIELANDSEFGLTASIWTKDIKRAEEMAEKIEAGTVNINDWSWTASEPKVPWPGAKASGNFIDEQAPYPDKVIAITRGNRLDRLSYFWFGTKTSKKLKFVRMMSKTYQIG